MAEGMTTNNPVSELSPADAHFIRLQLERLRQFEQTCDTLWPAIKFFGLTGAHPQYAVAAMEVGRLLGYIKDDSPLVDPAAVAAAARVEAIREVARWASQAVEVSKVAGRSFQAELAEHIAKLADLPPSA